MTLLNDAFKEFKQQFYPSTQRIIEIESIPVYSSCEQAGIQAYDSIVLEFKNIIGILIVVLCMRDHLCLTLCDLVD